MRLSVRKILSSFNQPKLDQPSSTEAMQNGAARWEIEDDHYFVKSPRVLPRRGIDDESVVKAIVVASVIWSVLTIAALLALYGLYRRLRSRFKK